MTKTAQLQLNLYGLKHLLTDAAANITSADYTGVFGDCQIGLFTSWPGANAELTLADLTEADYTGYARQSITWTTPYEGSDETANMISGAHVFRPTDSATPNTVIGAFIVDDDTNLVAFGGFDTTIPMQSDQDQATLLAQIVLDATRDYGDVTAED